MNNRERLQAALDHRQPDRVPVDFGGTAVTGIHVAALTRLRQAVTGDMAWRVKVIEPYQMLGEMDAILGAALGIDVASLGAVPIDYVRLAASRRAAEAPLPFSAASLTRIQRYTG